MARSILQNCEEGRYCFFCKKNGQGEPLDKHHVFGAAFRKKAEAFGLWVYLCHDSCHENGRMAVHRNARVDRALKAWAQRRAMKHFGWDLVDFRGYFGKNYIEESDALRKEKEA